jgi:Putative zinc-finger
MCEFSGNLVAWMDRELEHDEAAAMERHVGACAECRSCVAEFERVSGEFSAYCDALAQSKRSGRALRVQPVLRVAAAAAIVLAAFLAYSRRPAVPPTPQPNTAAAMSKPSPDSTRLPSVRLALDAVESGTAAVSPPRANVRRAHANRVLVNRGTACCTVADLKSATADSAKAVPSAAGQNANWVVNEPSVEIAIPAAAMFPPGAVPEGISFVADLSIGADGSVQQVRLQPQISEFERRSSQP